jgi:YHS domain-containing protein
VSARGTRQAQWSSSQNAIRVDYKLFTNILGVAIFAVLFALTARRGATDPVCGMKVDRAKAVRMDFAGDTYYFCSQGCRHSFEIDARPSGRAGPTTPGEPAARAN